MAFKLKEKKEVVAAVRETADSAFSAVVADYRGLTVGQLTALRAKAREENVYLRVVRNTLAKRALDGTNFELLNDSLVGPTIIGMSLSEDDMGAAARLLYEFAKDNEKLEIKSGVYEGRLLEGADIESLAKLPNREMALTQLVTVLQAPVSKFARLLTALKQEQEEAA